MNEKEQYRFENGSVFEYNENNAYEYVCNYLQASIRRNMSYAQKVAKMKEYEYRIFEAGNGHTLY